ncbi:hypothetical protein [Limosilactobacillus caviae]|uniref:hypothetical protein n=1 Tax=Limosilactobacillus caviae TaxID=1769424 RepID=UPI00351370FB
MQKRGTLVPHAVTLDISTFIGTSLILTVPFLFQIESGTLDVGAKLRSVHSFWQPKIRPLSSWPF